MSLFIQWMSTFVAGLIIAFTKSWKVTLFLFAFIPVLAICASFFAKVSGV